MLDATLAICFNDAAVTVKVPPTVGFDVTASIARTAVPPATRVRTVWFKTDTDVTPGGNCGIERTGGGGKAPTNERSMSMLRVSTRAARRWSGTRPSTTLSANH